MIEKEALNVMTQAREDAGQAFLGKVQFNVPQYHAVIKALEKQIPKKPHKNYEKVNLKWCECGNYLGELKNEQNYCKRCGQALDWGEED